MHELRDGTMYLLDGHEKHTVRATTELVCVCLQPAVTGRETHRRRRHLPARPPGGLGPQVPKKANVETQAMADR